MDEVNNDVPRSRQQDATPFDLECRRRQAGFASHGPDRLDRDVSVDPYRADYHVQRERRDGGNAVRRFDVFLETAESLAALSGLVALHWVAQRDYTVWRRSRPMAWP